MSAPSATEERDKMCGFFRCAPLKGYNYEVRDMFPGFASELNVVLTALLTGPGSHEKFTNFGIYIYGTGTKREITVKAEYRGFPENVKLAWVTKLVAAGSARKNPPSRTTKLTSG